MDTTTNKFLWFADHYPDLEPGMTEALAHMSDSTFSTIKANSQSNQGCNVQIMLAYIDGYSTSKILNSK